MLHTPFSSTRRWLLFVIRGSCRGGTNLRSFPRALRVISSRLRLFWLGHQSVVAFHAVSDLSIRYQHHTWQAAGTSAQAKLQEGRAGQIQGLPSLCRSLFGSSSATWFLCRKVLYLQRTRGLITADIRPETVGRQHRQLQAHKCSECGLRELKQNLSLAYLPACLLACWLCLFPLLSLSGSNANQSATSYSKPEEGVMLLLRECSQ
jgi:hypothetical protein